MQGFYKKSREKLALEKKKSPFQRWILLYFLRQILADKLCTNSELDSFSKSSIQVSNHSRPRQFFISQVSDLNNEHNPLIQKESPCFYYHAASDFSSGFCKKLGNLLIKQSKKS
ncbi:hypothetical protein ESP47_08160 [Heyndrickxia coagulans]|nr:hypothetical protein CIW84_05675 [Heyndrickxia coagulans]OZV91690.1 hypothetical protein CAY57_16710 [Heyndrickxia coagulans]QAU27058.1 hypothetical protein ESP47_08160 [Heyndrickxia coagulans]RCS32977.1 hypothetical protein DN050_06760 [Heyndrickxia coagulans]